MANLLIGPKTLIVNSGTQNPLAYHKKNASGAYVRSLVFDATAEKIVIEGFGEITKEGAVKAMGAKGVPSQTQQATLTFTVTSAANAAGGNLVVRLKLDSRHMESEFQNWNGEFKDQKAFVIPVVAADTPTTLAAKLNSLIALENDGFRQWISATVAAGVVTLDTPLPGITFTAEVEHDAKTTGNVAVAFAVTRAHYEGRGTWVQMNEVRQQTPATTRPYSGDSETLPIKGDKYSEYKVTFNVSRPDLAGPSAVNTTVAGQFELLIYANETRAAAWITDFTKWLNANVAFRQMRKADTAAEVLAGDTVTEATAVELTPFTTTLN